MQSNLYWITTITYAFLLGLIIYNEYKIKKIGNNTEKAFRVMSICVFCFCFQDTFWGLCENHVIQNDMVFFVCSSIFHLSTVLTTFFWLYYVLIYVGLDKEKRNLLLALDGIVVIFQVCLVIANIFTPTIFRIVNGEYLTQFLRPLTFINQYIAYVFIGVTTLLLSFSFKKADLSKRDRYRTVVTATFAPIVFGILQLIYPEAPFYSVGYFLSCFIIYLLVLSKDRAEAEQKNQLELMHKSFHDDLTGLLNRRSYDEELMELEKHALSDLIVFISMDVNGLKSINDTAGHAAGDRLIIGAAQCIDKCLSPYGKTFRTGGDEFSAILYVNEIQLNQIMKEFEKNVSNWTDSDMHKLTISFGYVMRKDMPDASVREMSIVADKHMYEAKANYYKTHGIDRRKARTTSS